MLPAPAGLFPRRRRTRHLGRGAPRARGAVPWTAYSFIVLSRVLPAPAELFPRCRSAGRAGSGAPRTRGAVPTGGSRVSRTTSCSPRPRSCSTTRPRMPATTPVLPAPAGLFPFTPPATAWLPRAPRAAGARFPVLWSTCGPDLVPPSGTCGVATGHRLCAGTLLGGLENRRGSDVTVGSNPTASAEVSEVAGQMGCPGIRGTPSACGRPYPVVVHGVSTGCGPDSARGLVPGRWGGVRGGEMRAPPRGSRPWLSGGEGPAAG